MESSFAGQVISKVGESLHLIIIFAFGMMISVKLRREDTWASQLSTIAFILLIISIIFDAIKIVQSKYIVNLPLNDSNFFKFFRFNLISMGHFFSELFGWLLLVLAFHKLKVKATKSDK